MKKLFIIILLLIPFLGNAQKIYVDAFNNTGVEDGTKQYPFNTVEEGITGSKSGDTIFVKTGNYSPLDRELKLRPGTILFGENPVNTIINADIRDTTRNDLPFEIHNLTFGEFYCSRGTNLTEFYTQPCIIKNNICQYISVGHAGGYTENGELLTFHPIPFFHIENNTVSGEITFNHGPGKIVGRNIIRNNTAETISLKHGAVTAPLMQTEPGYGYLIEKNTVTVNNNVWDHETISDVLKYDILNESTVGKLLLDFNSIIVKPATVQLSAPANQAVLTMRPALLSWQPIPSAETYLLQVSTTSGFGTLLLDTLVTASTFSTGNLPNQAVYHWRVQAVNLAGEGNWSETWQFSTLFTGIHENALEMEGVSVYPNPTTGLFRVCSSDPIAIGFKVHSLEVVDLNGRILEKFNQLPESDSREFDIGHLKPGVYFIRLCNDNQTVIRKIVKI